MAKKIKGGRKGGVKSFSGLEQLFGSRTRFGLLKIFCQNKDKEFFVRELARLSNNQLNAVRREVANLEELGIIIGVDTSDAKKKYYKLNNNFVLIDEISSLICKSELLAEKKLIEHFQKIGDIDLCIFSGVLIGKESPCDILIVGVVKKEALVQLIKDFENEINKTITYTVFSPEEYKQRKSLTDKFLFTIIEESKRVAIDKNGEFANESGA